MQTNTRNSPVVLLTGALTGIGRATTEAFATEGARLIVSGRREDADRQLVDWTEWKMQRRLYVFDSKGL